MARVALVNLASLRMPGNDPIFPLGVERIRQVLEEAGHQVRLVDFRQQPALQHDHGWVLEGWDVIGLTMRNIDPIDLSCASHVPEYASYTASLQAAAAGQEAPLWIGGGPGFSLFAEELTRMLHLDVGVVGPGESLMATVCADPTAYRGVGPRVLTGTPDPDFSTRVMRYSPDLMRVYAGDDQAMIGVETRRKSCYQGCTYCPYAHITKDDTGARRTMETLLEEVRSIHASGIRRVFFTDGIFNAELRYAKEVVAALNAADLPGLRWSAYFTPKPFDAELAELLATSSVEYVVVSPDSLDPGMMNELGKSFDVRHVRRFLDACRTHDLEPRVNVVLGGPHESEATARRTLEFANQHLRAGELALHFGYRVLPETAMSRQTRTSPADLLEPTFLELDPQVFQWVYDYLDPRFLTTSLMLNMAAARRGLRTQRTVPPLTSAARRRLPLTVA